MSTEDGAGAISLAEWAERWLASRPDLKPKSHAGYQSLLRSRIIPVFGQRSLSSIRPLEVQEWVADLQREGLSPSRIRQAANLLGLMLKTAAREGLVVDNPCFGVRLPRIPETEIEALTAGEVEHLVAAIRAPYGVLVHLLAYGGLRFGEAAALRRSRCELDRGRILVRESLAEVNGVVSFGATKTHQARRVAVPNFLVEMLADHLRDHVDAPPDALVFVSADGSPLRYSNFARRVWRPATKAIGRPRIGVHVLRHTCASLLIAEGAPIKAVQAQLGHRSAELTLDRYGHLYPDQLDVLAAKLDDLRRAAIAGGSRT